MILSTKLTNFRRHTNKTVDFTEGLVCVKGQNEAGKSTINEGILYSLFGSAALRTNFADAVTHGEPESSLKVETEVLLADRRLTFKRGKSGAEVIENGTVIVTGQKEVTNFAGTLLGAPPAAAMNLMIANQGSLRGVLSQGPKATSEFVEQLAEFDLFDRLIEAMQSKLMLGNTSAMEAEVEKAEAVLASTSAPVEPDHAALEAAVREAELNERAVKAAYEPYAEAVDAARRDLEVVRERQRQRDTLLRELDDVGRRIARLTRDRDEVVGVAKLPVDHTELADLRRAAKDSKVAEMKQKVKVRLGEMPPCTSRWEGSKVDLVTEIERSRGILSEIERTLTENEKKRAVLASTLVTSSTCGFCGQDVSQWPDVAKKNRETQASIADLSAQIEQAMNDAKSVKAYLADLNAVLKVGQSWEWVESHAEWLEIDRATYPPMVSWGAGEFRIDAGLETRLAELETLMARVEAAKAKLAVYDESLAEERARIERLESDMRIFGNVDRDYESAEAMVKLRDQARIEFSTKVTEASATVLDARQAMEKAVADYTAIKSTYDAAKVALDAHRDMLNTMRFNNTLLKKVRGARPIVSDKLWNTVLHSVSTMFSRMRGEHSIVSKDKEGFKVNGQSVESLSGSTLDILALAIRVSLVKVFLPNSNFLVLDEAASACDLDRSAAMYGFLRSAGFDQVVLVTHDDIGASVADQLVELA